MDIFPPDYYGFTPIAELLGSQATYVRASVYELSSVLEERFDVVLFLGVLYHLRHPLLALDEVRALTRKLMLLETAVSDHQMGERSADSNRQVLSPRRARGRPVELVRADRARARGLVLLLRLRHELVDAWPNEAPERAAVRCTPTDGEPEWRGLSYERPLQVSVTASLSDRWSHLR